MISRQVEIGSNVNYLLDALGAIDTHAKRGVDIGSRLRNRLTGFASFASGIPQAHG